MQNTKTFILKAAISSLLVLSTMSLADTQKVENTPFVSGQSLKKGFFWYNDKEPVKDEEDQPQQPLTGSPSQDKKEELKLDSRWLKENLLNLRYAAMDNPTNENLSRYYTCLLYTSDAADEL
ncbi:thioredoxin family protein, partial [Klebsiella pneumoniae]|nr:thioredoxin family protein [Klebsiella pneumoniae]